MRTISAALLAAQQSASAQPAVDVVAENRQANLIRLDFAALDTTANTITRHDACATDAGALIRVRIEGGAVKESRSSDPQTAVSTNWTTHGTGKGTQIACSAKGTHVIIVYTLADGVTIRSIESTDSGATYGAETVVGTAAAAVTDLAAAYSSSAGALAILWANSGQLWGVFRSATGVYGAPGQHATTQSSIAGVAMTFVFDWNIVVAGVEATTLKPTLWTTILGAGIDQAVGTFGSYLVQQQAESDAQVTYKAPSVTFTDQYRMTFTEADAFTGGATRAYRSTLVTGLTWVSGAYTWRTPAPVDYAGAEGLATCATTDDAYECAPDLVQSAPRTLSQLDVSAKLIAIDIRESTSDLQGTIDIDNTDGAYADGPVPLQLGNLVKVSWGYVIAGVRTTSRMADMQIASLEYRRTGGVSVLRIHTEGGWAQLARDRQRTSIFHAAGADSYLSILTRLFARAGISLNSAGASSRAAAVQPAFQIAPQTSAGTALRQALSFLADRVTMGTVGTAHIEEPLATDTTDYTFGTDHQLYDAQIAQVVTPASQAAAVGAGAFGEAIDYPDAQAYVGTRELIRDVTSTTGAAALATATAHLRQAQIDQPGGELVAPPACGLELLDVVDVSDPLISASTVLRRVRGIRWRYDIIHGTYDQTITLGAV